MKQESPGRRAIARSADTFHDVLSTPFRRKTSRGSDSTDDHPRLQGLQNTSSEQRDAYEWTMRFGLVSSAYGLWSMLRKRRKSKSQHRHQRSQNRISGATRRTTVTRVTNNGQSGQWSDHRGYGNKSQTGGKKYW